jgi:hypothetical protein
LVYVLAKGINHTLYVGIVEKDEKNESFRLFTHEALLTYFAANIINISLDLSSFKLEYESSVNESNDNVVGDNGTTHVLLFFYRTISHGKMHRQEMIVIKEMGNYEKIAKAKHH